MRRLRLVLLAVLASCGSPALPSGEIACGPGESCPDDMTCAGGLCWIDPPDEWDAAPVADAPPVDATPLVAEHAREAEDYDQLTPLGAGGQWTEEDELAGASGTYLIALPNDGVDCLDMPPTDCGALLVYTLPEMQAGDYYLHLRSSAAGASDDSLWYGFDGNVIDPRFDLPDGAAWAWRHEDLGALAQGSHDINIWVREDGAAFDRLVVSQSIISPE